MNYSVSETEELKPTARQIVSPVQPNPPPGNRPLCRLPTTGPHPVVPVARSDRIAQIQRFMGLIAVHIVFIAAVATLFGLSASRDGLWKVKDWNYIKETQGRFVDRSLWWTAVPTFFFSALGLYMKRCYDDVLELEPFLRLHQKPTSGASSVLLNYRSSFAPLAMIKAARHRHWISGLALGLTTFFTMLLVPLSSHLLETKLYQQRDEGLAWQTTNINLARMSGNADFNRAIDITSALGIYKGAATSFPNG
ncbi:unnamed protein product [Parascedosporium putredinis]|uniref:Uncharacterized protein n=1 Tax=Parascedosporium putredinis TaxID=1442378 RepID=A0A9P1M8E7_9PEZI|nr:unnamed protein product [Parascedosporium putredinis]CAI7992514.1 unnamed protein product [Parascedosporium putredinis]